MADNMTALASACAAIKACADLTNDGDERQLYIAWDDAELTALVASLLPPKGAVVRDPHGIAWWGDVADAACMCRAGEPLCTLHQMHHDWGEDRTDLLTRLDDVTRRRTPGEEQGQ